MIFYTQDGGKSYSFEFGFRKPPTAANAIQVSPEGGDHEELAGDGASPRVERVSNSECRQATRCGVFSRCQNLITDH